MLEYGQNRSQANIQQADKMNKIRNSAMSKSVKKWRNVAMHK